MHRPEGDCDVFDVHQVRRRGGRGSALDCIPNAKLRYGRYIGANSNEKRSNGRSMKLTATVLDSIPAQMSGTGCAVSGQANRSRHSFPNGFQLALAGKVKRLGPPSAAAKIAEYTVSD